MILGVDYHPEQWPEPRWPEDARLMKEAGVTVARLGDLAWSHIEADDNYYNLRWLNRVMDILLKHGVKVVIALPTASPPPWLVQKFPDMLPMDAEGRRLQPGLYNHRCFLNKHYHDYCRNLTMRLTKEIWGHRSIIGWQIGNKLGAHRCYCETCHRAFLDWLRRRYKDIETLNTEWGTVAMGQEYVDFIQIPLPWRKTGAADDFRAHNPSLILDFWRFHSEVILEFLREQAIIVQRYTTRQFITLNLDGLCAGPDPFALAKPLDFVACENPVERPMAGSALALDVVRGLKQKSFWVMEQPVGATGWQQLGVSLPPGAARARAWQSIGHGADGIVFNPWQPSPSGAGQLREGVLGHDGVPRRRYRELKQLGSDIAKTATILTDSCPRNETGILWDHEQIWALEIQPQSPGGLDYREFARRFHQALAALGLGCDGVGWQQDWKPYRLLLFPPQYLLEPGQAKKLAEFVANGGRAVVSTRSGINTPRNIRHAEPAPALLRDLLGIEIAESVPLLSGERIGVRMQSGDKFDAEHWCDILELKGAESLGSYADGFGKDSPAVTVRAHGKGRAYYVAGAMPVAFHVALMRTIAEELALRTLASLPGGVEVVSRFKGKQEFVFAINHSGEAQRVSLCRRGRELLTGAPVDSTIELEPFGVAVVQVETS